MGHGRQSKSEAEGHLLTPTSPTALCCLSAAGVWFCFFVLFAGSGPQLFDDGPATPRLPSPPPPRDPGPSPLPNPVFCGAGCVAAADTGALDAAVARGDREAMEWLAAAGLKGSSTSFCWAIENRDVELLAWLQKQGSRGEARALYDAAVRG